MTTDDLISMHKAAENIIADMDLLRAAIPRDGMEAPIERHAAFLADAVTTLATVQRDLLKAMIGG